MSGRVRWLPESLVSGEPRRYSADGRFFVRRCAVASGSTWALYERIDGETHEDGSQRWNFRGDGFRTLGRAAEVASGDLFPESSPGLGAYIGWSR